MVSIGAFSPPEKAFCQLIFTPETPSLLDDAFQAQFMHCNTRSLRSSDSHNEQKASKDFHQLMHSSVLWSENGKFELISSSGCFPHRRVQSTLSTPTKELRIPRLLPLPGLPAFNNFIPHLYRVEFFFKLKFMAFALSPRARPSSSVSSGAGREMLAELFGCWVLIQMCHGNKQTF